MQSSSTDMRDQALALLGTLNFRHHELTDFLRTVCRGLTHLFGGGLAAVTLYRDNQKRVLAEVPGCADSQTVYDIHGELSTYVVKTGKPLRISGDVQITPYGNMPAGYVSYLGVPLTTPAEKVIGTLCYFFPEPRQFSEDELNVAHVFAERAATAIDNLELYQQATASNQELEIEIARRSAQLLATQKALLEKERLAAIGEFASTITHEIRSPLSTIRLTLDYLKQVELPTGARKRCDLALGEITRLERLLDQTLICAKPIELKLARVDLHNVLVSTLTSIQHVAAARGQSHVLETSAGSVWCHADRDQLIQVILNLANNASEAAPSDCTLRWRLTYSPDQGVTLEIHNPGSPIPEALQDKLMQPFFTTKMTGTGLGLTVANRIVAAHGGTLRIQNAIPSGVTATVNLPAIAQ